MKHSLHILILASLLAACSGAEEGPTFEGRAVRFVKVTDLSPTEGPATFEGGVDFDFLPDDSGSYFVGYRNGLIELRGADHTVLGSTTLEVRRQAECGLLALEADPNFADNGRLWLGYCVPPEVGNDVSWLRWSDALPATVTSSDTTVLVRTRPSMNGFHNVGDLGFDERGDFWFTIGDLAARGTAVDPSNILGGVSRVRLTETATSYTIPPGNPFVGDPTRADELIAWGIKSPYRFSYIGGDRWLFGDVGLDSWEEINLLRLDGAKNFGYPACEGNERLDDYEPSGETCDLGAAEDYAAPLRVYEHGNLTQDVIVEDAEVEPGDSWAAVGGVLYEGAAQYDGLFDGRYFYSDFGRGFVRTAQFTGTALQDDRHFGHLSRVTSWKTGPDGYIYGLTGSAVYRIELGD